MKGFDNEKAKTNQNFFIEFVVCGKPVIKERPPNGVGKEDDIYT